MTISSAAHSYVTLTHLRNGPQCSLQQSKAMITCWNRTPYVRFPYTNNQHKEWSQGAPSCCCIYVRRTTVLQIVELWIHSAKVLFVIFQSPVTLTFRYCEPRCNRTPMRSSPALFLTYRYSFCKCCLMTL